MATRQCHLRPTPQALNIVAQGNPPQAGPPWDKIPRHDFQPCQG